MSLRKVALTVASAIGAQAVLRAVHSWSVNDVLGAVGLERRPKIYERVVPVLGLVLTGVAVGAGAALLLAPTSGTELRTRLSGRMEDAKHRLKDKLRDLEHSDGETHAHSTNGR